MAELKSIGKYHVWLRGSRKTISRAIRFDGEKYFIVWGGCLIEVKRGANNFYTVEEY